MACGLGKRLRIGALWLILAAAAQPASAQSLAARLLGRVDSLARASADTQYVRIPHERWMLRPFAQSKFAALRLQWNAEGASNTIEYRPNRPSQIGAFVAYRRIGLGLAFGVPGTSRDVTQFGETRHFDAQLFLFTRRWAADLVYARYQGMYVFNPRSIDRSWREDMPNPHRSDLRLGLFNANGVWVFNSRRFSLRAAFQQMEQQVKGAGSVLLLAGANLFRPDADSTLIPGSALPAALPHQRLRGARLASIGLAPGYGRAIPLWRFYLTPMAFLGPTLQTGWLDADDGRHRMTERVGLRFQFQGTLGYYSQRFFTGLVVRFDNVQYQRQDMSLTSAQFHLRLFAGWWFSKEEAGKR